VSITVYQTCPKLSMEPFSRNW